MIAERDLLDRLEHVRRRRDGEWMALCPAHADRVASLHVTRAADRWLLKCHAGCATADVLAAARLDWGDLFPENGTREPVTTYPYVDEAGGLLFQVVRYWPKDFSQRRPDGAGGWIPNLQGTRRVLYRLPAVIEAVKGGSTVYVVEGEKDVHAVERAGAVATTCPGGAGKWRPEYSQTLAGAAVVVIADGDQAGRAHAVKVAAALDGIAAEVRVVEPASGKDAAEHLAAGRTVAEFVPLDRASAQPNTRRARLTTASSIRSERVRWTWRDRIARRSMAVVAGEKGLGKSTFTNAWLVASATTGTLEGEFHGQPLDVLVLSAEDDWRSVVKPRLQAAGANLGRVHRFAVEDASGEVTFTLPDDVALIEGEIARLAAEGVTVGLIVVDPIGAFLGERTDSHKDASVRRALAPLAALAERADLAVVVVMHLTKDENRKLLARVIGSGAFVNAARSVLVVARDPDDPRGEDGDRRVLVQAATNWGQRAPARAARIEVVAVPLDDGTTGRAPLWVDRGESSVTVEDLQSGDQEGRAEVAEEIAAVLADGRRPSRDVKEAVATALKVSRRTVERHAVAMERDGDLLIHEKGSRKPGEPPQRTTDWELR